MFECGGPGSGRCDAQTIDQHQGVRAIAAANEHAGRLARPAGGANFKAGFALQQLGERGNAGRFNVITIDDDRLCQRAIERLQRAGGGDDDIVESVGGLGGLRGGVMG